jgi:hypothetical protein
MLITTTTPVLSTQSLLHARRGTLRQQDRTLFRCRWGKDERQKEIGDKIYFLISRAYEQCLS